MCLNFKTDFDILFPNYEITGPFMVCIDVAVQYHKLVDYNVAMSELAKQLANISSWNFTKGIGQPIHFVIICTSKRQSIKNAVTWWEKWV